MGIYSALKVPEYKKFGGEQYKKMQKDYFSIFDESIDQAKGTAQTLTDFSQAQLDRGMQHVFGDDYSKVAKEGLSTLSSRLRGEFTQQEQSLMNQEYVAKAREQGLAGSLAGINVGLSGMGKSMLAASQQALQALPGFMAGMKQTMMATPTRVESMFIPIQQYASQQAAENINQWRMEYAAAQAEHSAAMANTAYELQKQQASASGVGRGGVSRSFTVAHPNTALGSQSWQQRNPGRMGNPYRMG